MYDALNTADLNELASARGGHRVSIYMPTTKSGPDARENPIRLKNLLSRALDQLIEAGMRPTEARDMLARAHEIGEVSESRPELGNGLAVFIDSSGLRRYRLPIEVREVVAVSDRFSVKPLLRLFSEDGAFYLMALSLNDVHVYRCHRFQTHRIGVPHLPRGMAEALWPDDLQKQHQFHTAGAGVGTRGMAVHHSSGDEGADRLKSDIGRYFKMVDDALGRVIENPAEPLVLAAVDYLHPLYRDVSSYKTLLEPGLLGNPDRARPEDLAREAWPQVEEFYGRARQVQLDRFAELNGTGRASALLGEVISAAAQGRVEVLWVRDDEELWGTTGPDGAPAVHESWQPGDHDLLDLAAVDTITKGGRVFVVAAAEAPAQAPAAAIFRY